MGLFKRKKKVRRTENTYTTTQMYNDHNASLLMFAALQPTAIVDPEEQQREADEKFDAENAVDESPIEIVPESNQAQVETTPTYEAPVESSSYDSGSSYSSSYDSGSSSSYDSGSSYSDGGSSYSDSGSF